MTATAQAKAPPTHTVGEILRQHGERYRSLRRVTPLQDRVLSRLTSCRTPALGGFVEACDACDHRRIRYNPCRDRHCPSCGGHLAAEWVEARQAHTVPVAHYHLVFTLPSELRDLAFENARIVYDAMLRCAGRVVVAVGGSEKGVGAQVGLTTVLHTWSRDLSYHPHVHCIVSAGGLSQTGAEWRPCPREAYFAPQALLAARFRGALLRALTYAHEEGSLRLAGRCAALEAPRAFRRLRGAMAEKTWNVYAKAPFGDPAILFRYLGHYTHRIGIANRRILEVSDHEVTFRTRGEATTTVDTLVFIARFLDHVLPPRLVKVRHYGLYSTGNARRLAIALELTRPPPEAEESEGSPPLAEAEATPPPLLADSVPLSPAAALRGFALDLAFLRASPPEERRLCLPDLTCGLAALLNWIQVLPSPTRIVVDLARRCPACMFGYLSTTELPPFT